MPTPFVLTDVVSDLTTQGGTFNLKALDAASGGTSVSFNLGGGGSDSFAWYTEPSIPNLAEWPAGDYTLSADVDDAGADITYTFALLRVNSSGALQQTLGTSGSLSGTGLKSHTVNVGSPITTNAGDRLVGKIAATRGASHGNQALTISVNGANDQLIGAWSEAEPGNDDLGTPDGVTAGAPSLGAAALGQAHALAATGTEAGAPTLGTPAVGQVHGLEATGVDAGAPTLASPVVGQVHDLTATGVASGAPTLGTPALSEASGTDELEATGIFAGSPILGTPAVGQEHALTASGLATAAPETGTPQVGQEHALTASGLTAGAVDVGSPAIGQVHALSGEGLTAGSPALGSPVVGQVHDLEAEDLAVGAPSLGSPAIGTEGSDALTAQDLVTAAPSLGQPELGQVHALSASGLESVAPSFSQVVIGQVHVLDAVAVFAGAVQLGEPAFIGPVSRGQISIVERNARVQVWDAPVVSARPRDSSNTKVGTTEK